ncbi:uncharacterized protein [Periplaneta americana]|uniref:uncharacterized protein isoform X3 n=1 Tax=Periplaneta americana TaxID=6978 RepID=UPI0037E7915A
MSEDQKIMVKRVQFLLKVVELSLSIICVGLIVDPINHKMQLNMHHVALVYATFAGYIVVNTVIIIGQVKAERMPQYMWALLSFTAGAVFLAAGSVIIDDWRNLWGGLKHMGYSKQYMDMMIASGIIAIFNAFIYFVDFCLVIAFG